MLDYKCICDERGLHSQCKAMEHVKHRPVDRFVIPEPHRLMPNEECKHNPHHNDHVWIFMGTSKECVYCKAYTLV